jgi:transposase-like protein
VDQVVSTFRDPNFWFPYDICDLPFERLKIHKAQYGFRGGGGNWCLGQVKRRATGLARLGWELTGMVVNIQNLVGDARCLETVRQLRWPERVMCPHCQSRDVTGQGRDETQPERRRYLCKECRRRFDDLTGTIFAGRHRPLRTWILCLCFMGLNLSNRQIAQELDLNKDDVQRMTKALRSGNVEKKPAPTRAGGVECDEVDVVAGDKGSPAEVRKKGDLADDGG